MPVSSQEEKVVKFSSVLILWINFMFVGRLSWLVYIIGAVIGGRISFASTDEHDAMDGELACR